VGYGTVDVQLNAVFQMNVLPTYSACNEEGGRVYLQKLVLFMCCFNALKNETKFHTNMVTLLLRKRRTQCEC
jgi:hypothetical protein